MTRTAPQGMGVALITPFHTDTDAAAATIDYDSLAALIDYQIESGADFIVALGTTAETPTLTADERLELQQFIARKVNGRVPLVIGCGGNSTSAVVSELKNSDFAGYSAILSVAPFYNKPNQQGLLKHFEAVADASPIPVILYNVPGRTGINITPDTVGRLATHPNIVAIKEASGSVNQAAEIIRAVPDDFTVLSGDDGLTLPLISLGARGVISVLGNAMPGRFAQMVHCALEGRFDRAAKLHHLFGPLYRLLFAEGNPAGIKSLLSQQKRCDNILRLPLTPVSDDTAAKIGQFLASMQ